LNKFLLHIIYITITCCITGLVHAEPKKLAKKKKPAAKTEKSNIEKKVVKPKTLEKPKSERSEKEKVIIATDTATIRPTTAIAPKNPKDEALQKRMNKAFKGIDSNRIVKNVKKFNPKVQSKSAQDPNAFVYNNFYVSPLLYGKHAEPIYEYVKNYHKNFGARMGRVKSSNKGYFAMIDATLRKNNIPKEFHSLAVIESGLNPNAVSPVGAVGPWQFMEPTAEMLGLKVDETIDERRDFIKSTQAAARYCKRLHNIFHDWLLVVASYNCGPAPIIRNLAKTGGKSFWDIKPFLPKETQNHVMAFIATSLYYDKNSKVLDFGNLPKDSKTINTTVTPILTSKPKAAKKTVPSNSGLVKPNHTSNNEEDEDDMSIAVENDKVFDEYAPVFLDDEAKEVLTLKVKGQYNLEIICETLDITLSTMRRWNPKFNELAWPNNNQIKLTIPANKLDAFLIKKEKILQACIKNPQPSTPAAATKSIVSLQKEQQNTKQNKATVSRNPKTSIQTSTEGKKIHVVKHGEKLVEIAETFGLTIARLMELNKLTTQQVSAGHTLYLE
jgi:membrane-bound lytic murein transglycosylase D